MKIFTLLIFMSSCLKAENLVKMARGNSIIETADQVEQLDAYWKDLLKTIFSESELVALKKMQGKSRRTFFRISRKGPWGVRVIFVGSFSEERRGKFIDDLSKKFLNTDFKNAEILFYESEKYSFNEKTKIGTYTFGKMTQRKKFLLK